MKATFSSFQWRKSLELNRGLLNKPRTLAILAWQRSCLLSRGAPLPWGPFLISAQIPCRDILGVTRQDSGIWKSLKGLAIFPVHSMGLDHLPVLLS